MIFKSGSRGEDVKKIQDMLTRFGFSPGPIDGVFGNATRRAVIAFQTDYSLNADGIVGPETWDKLFPSESPQKPLIHPPSTREELYELFGDPLESGYWKRYGDFLQTPSELNHVFTYKWQERNGFWCNTLLIPVFNKVYTKIAKESLGKHLHSFDGCRSVRNIRGGDKLSMHSWAIAVDHNAKTNRLGTKGDMHPEIVSAFESEGFTWGGRFKRQDPMHFEFTKGGL